MRASIDTNVIIHLYKANRQSILFEVFDEGVFIFEQIRNIELENHGGDVLEKVDADIASGNIELYSVCSVTAFYFEQFLRRDITRQKHSFSVSSAKEAA